MIFNFVAVLDFLSEEAIDDAWLVASYLSDADFLLSSLNGHLSRDFGAENIIQSAAASVAARGVLFGNAHPVPSRYKDITWFVMFSLYKVPENNLLQIPVRNQVACYSTSQTVGG